MIYIKNNSFNPETVALGTEFASPFQFAGVVESDIIRCYTVSENIGYNSVYESTLFHRFSVDLSFDASDSTGTSC